MSAAARARRTGLRRAVRLRRWRRRHRLLIDEWLREPMVLVMALGLGGSAVSPVAWFVADAVS